MKIAGRIILAIVGAFLIIFAIPLIRDNWIILNKTGWIDFSSYPEKMLCLSVIVSQSINILFAFVAIVASIRGKCSFWLFVFSLIMICGVIWNLSSMIKAGELSDFNNVFKAIVRFSLPITYFIGSLFIFIRK